MLEDYEFGVDALNDAAVTFSKGVKKTEGALLCVVLYVVCFFCVCDVGLEGAAT